MNEIRDAVIFVFKIAFVPVLILSVFICLAVPEFIPYAAVMLVLFYVLWALACVPYIVQYRQIAKEEAVLFKEMEEQREIARSHMSEQNKRELIAWRNSNLRLPGDNKR